jgi:uncharacterized surface protein with fasciclin (FAS1) repeats
MKAIVLILLAILSGTVDAQDTAPPAVDLYSGQKEPEVTPEPLAPNVPELSQLDEAFKPKSLGKEADQRRLHIEWRQLKNRVVNDPSVRAAKAAALAARTDLEKRDRLRNYYNVYYDRMSALAASAEMKLALEAFKTAYFKLIDQPRVRPSPTASSQAPTASSQAPTASLQAPTASLQLPAAASAHPEANADIIVAAKSTRQVNMFVLAMNFTGKAATLKENGPVTVFAPTDAAFKSAPPGTIDFPFDAEKLGKLLAYHIVQGAVTSKELTTRKAQTLDGGNLDIKAANGQITVNDAHVIKADVKASNGVIYVIDKVLIPPAPGASPPPAGSSPTPTPTPEGKHHKKHGR